MLKVNTQSDPGWKLRATLAPERAPEGLGREGRRRERFRERSWEGLTIQIAQHEAPELGQHSEGRKASGLYSDVTMAAVQYCDIITSKPL